LTDEHTIIKANDGFFVATYLEEKGNMPHSFLMSHVIAWKLKLFAPEAYEVTPLTVEGSPERVHNLWMVKDPSGKYLDISRYGGFFETEPEALDWCRDHVAEKKQEWEQRHACS